MAEQLDSGISRMRRRKREIKVDVQTSVAVQKRGFLVKMEVYVAEYGDHRTNGHGHRIVSAPDERGVMKKWVFVPRDKEGYLAATFEHKKIVSDAGRPWGLCWQSIVFAALAQQPPTYRPSEEQTKPPLSRQPCQSRNPQTSQTISKSKHRTNQPTSPVTNRQPTSQRTSQTKPGNRPDCQQQNWRWQQQRSQQQQRQ